MAKHKYFDKRLEAVQQKWIDTVVNKLATEGKKVIEQAYNTSNNGSYPFLSWNNVSDGEYWYKGLPWNYPTLDFTPPYWQNISGNLRNAYGSAVYVYGKLRKDSMRFVGGKIAVHQYQGSSHEEIDGRQLIEDYLSSYPASPTNVIEFIIANAAPYARSLEKGHTWGKNEYIVISQMADEMEAVNNRLNIGQYRRKVKKIGDF